MTNSDYRPHILVALASMKLEIKSLNVDANLHEHYGADYASAIKASRRRSELRLAIQALSSLIVNRADSSSSSSSIQ